MCSGATQPTFEEGRALSPAMAFQQTTYDKGKEGSSTSCTLVQSVRLWASWEHKRRAKRRGPQQPSALAGRIWPQVIRSCKIAGRRKVEEEEEKGDYSTSSLLCRASTLCWLLALGKRTLALPGALGMVQLAPCRAGGPPWAPHPLENQGERSWQEQVRKEDAPATNTPVKKPVPGHASAFGWRHLPISSHAGHASLQADPQTLPRCRTETKV